MTNRRSVVCLVSHALAAPAHIAHRAHAAAVHSRSGDVAHAAAYAPPRHPSSHLLCAHRRDMSAHPSASGEERAHTPAAAAAGLPSAAAAAGPSELSPSSATTHPTTVMQAAAGVSGSVVDSAVGALPGKVTPSSQLPPSSSRSLPPLRLRGRPSRPILLSPKTALP